MTGCPRMNKEPEFLAAKLRRVRDPHVQPLNELVERWRQEGRQVPYADPDSGRGAGAGWAIGRLTAPGTSPKYCVTSR